jgi:predicted transcriptional regulator
MKDVMTIRIEREVKKKLDQLARSTARTKSFLVADAIQEYIRTNEWQIEAIEKGVEQADAERLVSHEEVKKKWRAKLAHPMD